MVTLPKSISAFIVTNPVNIFYLTNFKGVSPTERESILVLTDKKHLIVPKLYRQEAQLLDSKDLKVHVAKERDQMFAIIKKLLAGKKRIGFEEESLKYSEYSHLKKLLTRSHLVPLKNFVEDLRIKKTADELSKIEKAQIISQKAFEKILPFIKTGQTEAEIAEKLEKVIKILGGHGLAFESIVAIGQNSAKPHHVTGYRKLVTGDALLFDFGAKYKNYLADLSRTVFIGKAKNEQAKIYQLVSKAQKQAIKTIRHKLKASSAYHSANDVFKAENLHNSFIHGLGHGIGLEVHEAPYLRSSIEDPLEEGMVFSIEPGLYFPKWGGVRIEDLITIKNGKAKVLGKLQEELIIL